MALNGAFVGLMLLACVTLSQCTTCTTATDSTCAATLFTTATCTSSACVCATGYTAVDQGCGVTGETVVEAPTVWAGSNNEFNGNVETGATITLHCKSNMTSPTYSWFKDGVAISGQTANNMMVPNSGVYATADNGAYGCKVTVSSVDSSLSDTITLVEFTDTTDLYLSSPPVVSGMPTNMTSGQAVSLVCGNQPSWAGSAPTFTWATSPAVSAIDATTTVNVAASTDFTAAGTTVTCTVIPGSGRLAWTASGVASASVAVPSSFNSVDNIEEVSVYMDPADPVVGGYVAVRCLVRATTMHYPTGATYSWRIDTDVLPGMTDHTLQINALVAATHGNGKVYKCDALIGDLMASDSTGVTTTSTMITAPATPTIGGTSAAYATASTHTFSCDSTSESPGMIYEWTIGGTIDTTKTSKTISVTATSTSTTYSCKVKIGSSGTQSTAATAATVLAVDVTGVVLTGPTKPITAVSATWTCTVAKGASVSVTYVWKKATTAISGATSSTYTIAAPASSDDAAYTCEATPSGGSATASNSLTVAIASTADAPTVSSSATTYQTGESVTLACASEHVVASAVYEWKFTVTGGSEVTLSNTAATYTISSFASTNAGAYTCKVTVGSVASVASSSYAVAHDALKGKLCSNIATCTSDFTLYTGNCVAGTCECASGASLGYTACTASSSTAVVGSMLLMTVGLVTSRFL